MLPDVHQDAASRVFQVGDLRGEDVAPAQRTGDSGALAGIPCMVAGSQWTAGTDRLMGGRRLATWLDTEAAADRATAIGLTEHIGITCGLIERRMHPGPRKAKL